MTVDVIGLWRELHQNLPPFFAGGVFALVLLAVTVLLILPVVALLRSETEEVWRWYQQDRGMRRAHSAHGATTAERLLRRTLFYLELLNRFFGHGLVGLALIMVLVQFAVVVLRYVFAFGSLPMQESIWYMHAILFMLGAGYTLLMDAHVRVDIIYAHAGWRYRSVVDLLGSVFFVLPLCATTAWLGWDYVANAWSVREGSIEVSGLPYLYLLKTVILLFALLVGVEALATIIRSAMRLKGLDPGNRNVAPFQAQP
jgi:TRAP-type mannitol/chloroaromatic compound transport system permease small subunit